MSNLSITTGNTRGIPVAENPLGAIRRASRIAIVITGLLVFGLGGGAALVQVGGAVVASGEVMVASRVKKIAHPSGGVIAQIYVGNGDQVKAGEILMRLDSTVSSLSARASGQSYWQLLASRARLTAERDALGTIAFPAELTTDADPAASHAMSEAERHFVLRRQARAGERSQLIERARQMQQQIVAYEAQAVATRKETHLIEPERSGVHDLWKRNLVTIGRLNELERTAVGLESTAASTEANIAQTRARVAEIRQQILQIEQDARSQAAVELVEVESRLADQSIRRATAGDTFDRAAIRAPQAGIVDKLAFNTIGGVIPPTETIMEIVPSADRITVEVKISPADIDQLHNGQSVQLLFSAFNRQTTPEISGYISRISADRTVEPRSGSGYFTGIVEVPQRELRKLGKLKLVPGMPVETFIQTGNRSLLSYVTKPFRDHLSRTFREN